MFVLKKYDRKNQVLWRNISDFYVNLRVEVEEHPQVILAMYFYLVYEKRNINTYHMISLRHFRSTI